jgi:hypothetical protein
MFMQVIQLPENAWKTPENLVTLYYLKETMAVRRPAWNEGKRELIIYTTFRLSEGRQVYLNG